MRIIIFILFCLIATKAAQAQDERFFRKIFSGEFLKEKKVVEERKYSYVLHSPEYLIDLNDDGESESIVSVKRDSEDWIDVFNFSREKIFSYQFEAKGAKANLFRVIKKHINPSTVVLVLFFYEGETGYINFESSARVYFMAIDNKDLKKISMFKGPSIFEESKNFKSQYHLRNYEIKIEDFNQNSSNEILIKYRGMSQAFIYAGNGKWKSYQQ
jgi:hypothetical protein